MDRRQALVLAALTDALLLALVTTAAILVLAPVSGYVQGPGEEVLYEENFDDVPDGSQPPGWQLDSRWSVTNGMLLGNSSPEVVEQRGTAWATCMQDHWDSGRIAFRFTIIDLSGILHFNVFLNQPNRYAIGAHHFKDMKDISFYIFKQRGQDFSEQEWSVPIDYGEFIDNGRGSVEIVVEGGNINVYVAMREDPVVAYSDSEMLPPGTFAFEIVEGTTIVDDVVVIGQRETTVLDVYSLPLEFLEQDPTSEVGSDLHATVTVEYALNGQSQSTTQSTPFSFEVDVDSEVILRVASSPAAWEFSCTWEDYGYARHDSCSLTMQVVSDTRKVTAFFRERMQPCDYSLSANPPRIAVQRGSSTSVIVSVSLTSGSCEVTTLSISSWGGSSGLSANFRPASGTPNYVSGVEISASSTAGEGVFTILIAASGPVAPTRSTSITVAVTAAIAPTKTEMPDPVLVGISAAVFATTSIIASLVARRFEAGKGAGQVLEEGVSRPLYDVLASADKYRDEDVKRRIRRTRELASVGVAVLIVGSVLAYSESPWPTQGTLRDLLDLLPGAIVFASTVLLASHVARLAVSNRLGERIEYKLSVVAVLAIFVTTLLKAPFGSPGDVSLRKEAHHHVKGKISLAAMAAILATSGIFYLLLSAGLPTELGVYFGLTLAAASAIPVRPLTGHSICQYNRKMSGALLIVCFSLLFLYLSTHGSTLDFALSYLTISVAVLLCIVVLYPERARRPRSTKPPESQFQFCMSCGASLPELSAAYCGRCGARQQYPRV